MGTDDLCGGVRMVEGLPMKTHPLTGQPWHGHTQAMIDRLSRGPASLWELANIACRSKNITSSLLQSMSRNGHVRCVQRGKAGHYPAPSWWALEQ